MRKIFLGVLAYFLVFVNISQVYAAQTLIRPDDESRNGSYLSTPKKVYTDEGWVSKFNPDGKANYPEEIYLPNELSPGSYRIHTNYTKNTDACASCHATHTAVGESLLQWHTSYETCMACHDGTVSTTYNVTLGELPNRSLAPGGAFGTGIEKYSSYHNVTGGAMIGSAPGNNLDIGQKNQELLGCESCHSPHGLGGNARLLNPDPNGVQSAKEEEYTDYNLMEITDPTYSELYVTYVAYPKKPNGSLNTAALPYYMLNSYPYRVKLTINGEVYNQQGKIYKIDNNLGYTKVQINKLYNIQINEITASFIPSIRVRMNITNYLGNGGPEVVTYRDGTVQFCSACHGYYQDTVGMAAYRHPVNKKIFESSVADSIYTDSSIWVKQLQFKFETDFSMTCLTCHVAHGTSDQYWQDSIAYTSEQSKEQSGSSSLKRAPNSDLCELCHNNQEKNEGYDSNTQQPHNEPQYATNDALFTQPLGVANYQGDNESSCYSNASSSTCHGAIVDTWKTTEHKNSFQDNSPPYTLPHLIDEQTLVEQTGLNAEKVIYIIGSNRALRFVYNDGTLKVANNEYVISNNSWVGKPRVDNFVRDCAGCHVTGLDIGSGEWKDNGIACEACHGAAKNHFIVPSSSNITNPRSLNVKDQTDICAQCHALGYNVDETYDLYPYPIGYMPYAEGLKDSVSAASYELKKFFMPYEPGGAYEGNFFDEKNSVSSFTFDSSFAAQEFNDFVQSKHYQSGAVSCITCHSSHKHNNQQQMLKLTLAQTCGTCHGSSFNLDAVMPKRIKFTNNIVDNLRVHTFATQHSTGATYSGNVKEIH